MRTEVVLVTPELAKTWLKQNKPDNRKQAKTRIKYYAEEMAAGRWQLTSQGIAFNTIGQLTNGQHRLAAIIEANVPIQMSVTYDEPIYAYTELDTGAKRTMADIMHIDRKEIAVYSVFYRLSLFATTKTRMSKEAVIAFHDYFAPSYASLVGMTNSEVRTFSAAPIKAACMIGMERKDNRGYALQQYRALILQHYDSMSSVNKIFSGWLSRNNGKISLSKSTFVDYLEIFSRASIAFDEDNASYGVLQLTQDRKEAIMIWARNIISGVMSLHKPDDTHSVIDYVKPILNENSRLKSTVDRLEKTNRQLVENEVHNFRELSRAD